MPKTVAPEEVNVTLQYELELVAGTRVQMPPAAPSFVKLTVPDGTDFEPFGSVSVTVAVHEIEPFVVGAISGVQEMVVLVCRLFTGTSVVPPGLDWCSVLELSSYTAVIVRVPEDAEGVYVTEHELLLLVAVLNEHVLGAVKVLPAADEKAPEPDALNVTVPVGIDLLPASVSDTVAVQTVA
jgi:hypothetical protein